MSAATEVKVEEQNGGNGRQTKPRVPVYATEQELHAHPGGIPVGMKVYRCTLPETKKVGFTADFNPQAALTRFCMSLGANAVKLDKVPSADKLFGETMSLSPEALREFIARVQASAHLAGDNPTGNLSKKK